jgi:ubiquinone/menaquinone biosynthesis C-methylase UbiE
VNPTGRFADRAVDYAAARPSYPAAAIEAVFDGLGDDVVVADLGAGTGISTRLLATRASLVYAIEPNANMRAVAEPAPRIRSISGTAEETGLEEASIDLVTAFQAFHWFDAPAALSEMTRILRPGGRAALVYNERDEADPFTAGYGAILRRAATDDTEQRRVRARLAFAAHRGWRTYRELVFRNSQRQDLEGLLARARSSSYLPKDGPAGAALADELRALFAAHERDGTVTMHLATLVAIGESGADGG